ASRGDLAFLEYTKPDDERIEKCQTDLQKLAPLPRLIERVDPCERFMFLDLIMTLHRRGDLIGTLRRVDGLSARDSHEHYTVWENHLQELDWDQAFQNANRWFERLSVALSEKERGPHLKRLKQFEKEVLILRGDIATGDAAKQVISGKISKEKLISDFLISFLFPSMRKAQDSADRAQQTLDNVIVAFALARYQR